MAAMFYMASVLFYLNARSIQQRAKSRGQVVKEQDEKSDKLKLSCFYILSMLCGMFAFLSKQNAASLPGAILLVEFLLIDRTWRQWKKKLPWFAISFVFWILFVLYISGLFSGGFEGSGLLEDVSGLMKETETVSRWQYLFTQFNVLVIYIRLLFLPVGQNLDYLYPFKSGFFDAYTPFAFLFLIVLFAFGTWQIKKRPVFSLGIFWFFITLSVESSIIPIRDALFEHRLYLPIFGFALMAAYLLFHFLSKRRLWAIVISVIIILLLSTATYMRNIVWSNEVTLWEDCVEKSPQKARAHNNLGKALSSQGRTAEAIDHFLQALRIKPYYVEAHNNLGNALDKQGRIKEAIDHYVKALCIKPNSADAHYNLGIALKRQGRAAEAIDHYLQALRINPDYAEAHNNLGLALAKQGRTTKESIDHYEQALRIKPDYVDAHNNLGVALFRTGDIEGAISSFRNAIQINPDNIYAKNNLKKMLMMQQQKQ